MNTILVQDSGGSGHEPFVSEAAPPAPNDPPRLVDDDASDVHMQRDLLRTVLSPGLLYPVRRGLRRFRARLEPLLARSTA
jgi:hypothetical protein